MTERTQFIAVCDQEGVVNGAFFKSFPAASADLQAQKRGLLSQIRDALQQDPSLKAKFDRIVTWTAKDPDAAPTEKFKLTDVCFVDPARNP